MSKMSASQTPAAAPVAVEGEASTLMHTLMQGQARGLGAVTVPATPDASHSILIGELLAYTDGEAPQVRWATGPQEGVPAMSLVPIRVDHVGAPLALSFGAGMAQPLILGLLWQPGAGQQRPVDDVRAVHVECDGKVAQEVVIGATQQLTLHCGDASITLTADGQILMRGEYISSHATGTQRIKGAAVRIN